MAIGDERRTRSLLSRDNQRNTSLTYIRRELAESNDLLRALESEISSLVGILQVVRVDASFNAEAYPVIDEVLERVRWSISP